MRVIYGTPCSAQASQSVSANRLPALVRKGVQRSAICKATAQHVSQTTQQSTYLGGVGDGRLLVRDHRETVRHGDHVHRARRGQDGEHGLLGHVVLHHAGDVLDAHGVDAFLGHLQEGRGDVTDHDLLEVLADGLHLCAEKGSITRESARGTLHAQELS
jgi:hypothetical protein